MATAGPGTTPQPNVPPPEDHGCYEDGMLCVPRFVPKQKYVVLFGRKSYTVPYENVWLVPKYTNRLQDNGVQLGNTLSSRNWHNWHSYLRWGRLCVLTGIEGMGVYTTFALPSVDGTSNADEQRILRPVPHQVLKHAFDWPQTSMPPRGVAMNNQRRQRRCDIYKWTKEIDMPHHAQINPERNGWPATAEVVPSRAVRMFYRRSRPPSPRRGAPAPESESDENRQREALAAYARNWRGLNGEVPAHWHFGPEDEEWEEPEPEPEPESEPEIGLEPESEPENEAPRITEARDALRQAEADLFEAQTSMPEGTYLKLTGALKRTWDCL